VGNSTADMKLRDSESPGSLLKWGLCVVFIASIALAVAIVVSDSAYPQGEYYFITAGEYIWQENGSGGGWEPTEDLDLTGLNLPGWVLFVRQNEDSLFFYGMLAFVISGYCLLRLGGLRGQI